MGRKRISNMITLNSWQDCDDALRQIGEHERDILAIENVMNEQIAAAKSAAADRARPLKAQVEQLALALKDFAEGHRDDMDGKKSKALTFGTIGFRKSSKISLPLAKERLAAIIARLRTMGMQECVVSPEPRVDKEALKKYSADVIAETGAVLIVRDEFGYEVNMEQLKD